MTVKKLEEQKIKAKEQADPEVKTDKEDEVVETMDSEEEDEEDAKATVKETEEKEAEEDEEDLEEEARPADNTASKEKSDLEGAEAKASKKGQDTKGSSKSAKRPADKAAASKEKEQDMDKEESPDAKRAFDATQERPNLGEDVDTILAGNDLSDEFKEKAKTIFEAAFNRQIKIETARIDAEKEEEKILAIAAAKEEIVTNLDSYLGYTAGEWLEENKLAVERGIRVELTEKFVSQLATLLKENYIDIPEEACNLVEEQAKELETLKGNLNDIENKCVALSKEVSQLSVEKLVNTACSDLPQSDADKLRELSEGIEYKDVQDFEKKLDDVKSVYFADDTKKASYDETIDGGFEVSSDTNKTAVDVYADQIAKGIKSKNF